MSMNPDPQGQRPGFFGRVQDFFTTGDPNAGQATDPFAGLSRAQRTVLGFAALRDAAAALEGRDSAFFNQAMGGFEAGRERERLRAQGQMQNQVGALQALAQIEQQIAFSQSLGMAPSPAVLQLRDMLTAQAMGGGAPTPAVVRDGGTGAMPSPGDFTGGVIPTGGLAAQTGAIPGDQYLAEMQRTGEIGVDAQGNVMPEAQPAPAPSPAPAAAPSDPMADIDARIAQQEQTINQLIGNLPGREQVLAGQLAGVDIGIDPQTQATLNFALEERNRLMAQREALAEAQQAATQEAEQTEATRSRMQPLINDALGFLLDDEGNIRTLTSQAANVSGFGAGLFPGVSAADARLARAAVTELGAIAAMNSVREAREAGFGGALSDADILLIQRSGGTFDLSQPEATARTLQRLQAQMAQGGTGGQGEQLVTLPDGTQVRIRVRD